MILTLGLVKCHSQQSMKPIERQRTTNWPTSRQVNHSEWKVLDIQQWTANSLGVSGARVGIIPHDPFTSWLEPVGFNQLYFATQHSKLILQPNQARFLLLEIAASAKMVHFNTSCIFTVIFQNVIKTFMLQYNLLRPAQWLNGHL